MMKLWLFLKTLICAGGMGAGVIIATAEETAKVDVAPIETSAEVEEGTDRIAEPASRPVADERLTAAIQAYNAEPEQNGLLVVLNYLGGQPMGAAAHLQAGRELAINPSTVDLHLELAESVFRGGNIATDSGLGFMILRLDASGFWREATSQQRGRFELLLEAIDTLPEERVHRFTRFSAQKALERIEAASQPEGPSELLHYLTRRQRFEVFGMDYNAIQSVGAMAQALEQIVADYLPYVDDLPAPLWVRIQQSSPRTPPYQLRIGEDGNVGVVLFWNEQISMDEVAQALSWAMLQRIAIWRWGARDEQAVPYWLWRALATEIAPHLQPARNQGLAREVAEVRTLDNLQTLLARRAIDTLAQNDRELSLQSLWFYRYLRNQAPSRQTFGQVIEAFLSEPDGTVVLLRAFPALAANPDAAQQWWEVGLTTLMHRQQGVVYSLKQSNELVESLSGVTAWWDGQDRRLRGPALLPMRDDPRWQSAFWRKQRELKLDLQRVNPIYFNALLSLGQFYDLLLARAGDLPELSATQLRAETEAAYARFQEDWVHAQALHRAVEQVLRDEGN